MRRLLLIAIVALPAVAAEGFWELYEAGIAALGRGEASQARQALEEAVELNPKSGPAWLALARSLEALDDDAGAERAAGEAATLAESDPALAHGVALYYAEIGDAARAGRFEAQFARATGDPRAYFQATTALLGAGEAEAAAELAAEGLAAGQSAELHNLHGKALASLGRIDEAAAALGRAVELAPYDEELHYDRGYVFLQAGRFEEAVASLEASRKTFDKSPRLELGVGVARYGQRRFDEAVEAFLRTSRLAPAMPQPHYFLGEILQHGAGRIDEIRERVDAFAEAAPDSYLAPFLQAKARLAAAGLRPDAATLEAAEAGLRRSIALRNDFWQAHFELGVALDRRRQWDEAARALERAVELSPQSPTPRYRLARVYSRLGKAELAAAENAAHARLERELRQSLLGGEAGETPAAEALK